MCDLLDQLGPDRPTLCGDWTTRDLLAHLLVRERRPDASLGIVVPMFSGRTEAAMKHVAEQSFTENVNTFRTGPPIWTPWAIPVLGDRANLFEFYVHHEDIRRAQPEWEPRPTEQRREDALWGALTMMGRLLFRRCPGGVVLARRRSRRLPWFARVSIRCTSWVNRPRSRSSPSDGRPRRPASWCRATPTTSPDSRRRLAACDRAYTVN